MVIGTPNEYGTQREVADGYNFFYGTPSQQAAILSSSNWFANAGAGYIKNIWPAFYKWATSCAGHGTPCGVRGLAAYEGGYTAPTRGGDQTLRFSSATRSRPCVLNMTSNGAVAGMPVSISGANPSGYNGTFIVGANPTSTTIPLLDSDGVTPFDCSGLGSLASGTLTYTGSANYINYMRNMSYVSPALETAQKDIYDSSTRLAVPGCHNLTSLIRMSSKRDGWRWGMTSTGIFPLVRAVRARSPENADTWRYCQGTVSGRSDFSMVPAFLPVPQP